MIAIENDKTVLPLISERSVSNSGEFVITIFEMGPNIFNYLQSFSRPRVANLLAKCAKILMKKDKWAIQTKNFTSRI